MSKYYEISKSFLTIFIFLCIFSRYLNHSNDTLSSLSEGLIKIINGYVKFKKRTIKLSDHNILYLENITAIFTSDPPFFNPKEQTIDYFNTQVNFIFNTKLVSNPYGQKSSDFFTKKNITIQEKKATILIFFPRFHIFKNNDNSFDYDHYMVSTYQEHHFGQIEEYELCKNLISEFGENNLNIVLERMWFDYIDEILTIYPVSDSLYNFRQVNKYIQQVGNFSINYPDAPGFKWVHFKTVRHKGIVKEYPYSRRIKALSFEIEYFWDYEFKSSVYFDYIIFSQKNIVFGKMYPPNRIKQNIIQFLIHRALEVVLGNENNE